ncbi:bifunctional cobalt-precorrin-7 (C(5))-methyltransferase/cobalt-precorrin-6B (C(15))-methyltransferase [Flammeovirga pacifica]|uniref:Tetrapyrrole methylase domain-containing protein n=1 Tax=Flammeovirga pacifica TaxID=915059 RepID=A0A1S1Z5I4_FLAPC|nr:bifunctional cobalt-precorrin-7 (C(5))-methyltransferase/cobalt-precorrin-6B (C(15))-methyltransferase [Flammeovirga pacifica]OHX68457.1 hypothetical protein NH26_05625 [Flammeovirga pacifica]
MDLTVVGIGNHPQLQLSSDIENLINTGKVFSGGKRHYEIVQSILPKDHIWIEISGAMQKVISSFTQYDQKVIIFASGDPLFFGFGNTIKRLLPEAKMTVYPYFNSIQRLAHKTQVNYSDIKTISLHGRHTWKPLDISLIQGESLIGILTDNDHSPQKIAKRLLEHNYTNYQVIVGEELDGSDEKIQILSLENAQALHEVKKLNCILLIKKAELFIPRSFEDRSFQTLEGRPGMITKQSIRTLSLESLSLWDKSCFWDIGSCTGAIAIEAKLNYPKLNVFAFEKRIECEDIIDSNTKSHFCPGVNISINDFFDEDLNSYSVPNAVFIGGHGNRLRELIVKVDKVLQENGIVVMNTILEKSYQTFMAVFDELKYELKHPVKIKLNEYNTVHILVAQKI